LLDAAPDPAAGLGEQISLSKDVNSACATAPFTSGAEPRVSRCGARLPAPSALNGIPVRRLTGLTTPSHGTSRPRSCFGLVPGIGSGAVQIRGFAREPGRLCLVCVDASDRDSDPIARCVPGVRSVVRSLASVERVVLVRWSDSPETLIRRALTPARLEKVVLDARTHRAGLTITAYGSASLTSDGGLRVRLASRLTGWDLELITP